MSAENPPPPDPQERLAALGRVMGELVHDLNNEVAVLQGWSLLARGELEAGRLPMSEMERVVGITEALGHMLRDVLDTVAGRALSPEVSFDPAEVTEQTLADRVRGFGSATLHLHSTLDAGTRVPGRASFWVRALANLVGNAARHASGQVAVTLSPGTGREGEPLVVLRVEDDGPGISPEQRETIFDPFWRGRGGETGLGLSSAAWAVAELRGTIAYRDDSALGGAAFEVRVPAATPLVSGPAPERPAAALEAIRGARILIVDDDPAVRQAIRKILQRAGVDVRELDPDGEPEAHLVESILAYLPDAVLLDLRLGERGGLSLWSRLYLEIPHLASRVIFASGAAPGEPDWEEARLTGQPLLGKPFDLGELARHVRRLRTEP